MDTLRIIGIVLVLMAGTGVLVTVAAGMLSGLVLDAEPAWMRRTRQTAWGWLWAALALGVGCLLLSTV